MENKDIFLKELKFVSVAYLYLTLLILTFKHTNDIEVEAKPRRQQLEYPFHI